MNNIPKKIHYIWFGKGKKSTNFMKYLSSWKENCPDYEIIEWNEDNFDVSKNFYCKKFYDKQKWALASDYARFDILYNEGGIYLDTDIEILKNMDELLKNKSFYGFQDVFSVGGSIIGSVKGNEIIKEVLTFYKTRKRRIILPNLLNRIFKKYGIKNYSKKIVFSKDFTIYPKEYFYPYAYFEKRSDMEVMENTYTIHNYDATWLPKVIVKYIFPLIGIIAKLKFKK